MTNSERKRFIRSRFSALSKQRAEGEVEVDRKATGDDLWDELKDKAYIDPVQGDEEQPEEDQRSA